MKKITDFIINKRYFLLGLFLIFTVISLFLTTKVNINDDMAKYLPKTSETRIGMDIMEREFSDDSSSTLGLLMQNLSAEDKKNNAEYFNSFKNVTDLEITEKDDYILYTLTVNKKAKSEEAKDIYEKIKDKYSDNIIEMRGTIDSSNKDILPFWIVALAVFCALIILIIMSKSYFEPFLFLFTILLAIILNNGSNIIFSSVSNITSSISAILQMALSMDYSIMLMNRYEQERENEKDNVVAMKNALYHSFKSISSSSITTIVGLLALVFMSFTIGKDLGFVLAKGVLFSLLTIFTCLPGLILISDKLIRKTKKKEPHIKLDWLGNLAYHARFSSVIIFILIFVVSFFAKGNLTYLFTEPGDSKIEEVFGSDNQIAIIYKNNQENMMQDYCQKLDNGEDEVLCYGNTINDYLKYDELKDKLSSLGSDVNLDDYLAKILYYHYYNEKEDNKMSFADLVTFLEKDVYQNATMAKNIDKEMRNNITKLSYFTSSSELNKARNMNELNNIFKMDKDTLENLLIYYNSQNNTTKISLKDFTKFMNDYVLKDKDLAKDISTQAKNNLNLMSEFTNPTVINSKLTYSEMANLLGMDKNTMQSLYAYYLSLKNVDTLLTINNLATFMVSDILPNPLYSNNLTDDIKDNITILNTFSNLELINREMNSSELSKLFNINENIMNNLLVVITGNSDIANIKLTPYNFVSSLLNNSSLLANLDNATLTNLKNIYFIMDSTINNKTYSYEEMATILKIDAEYLKNIYSLYLTSNATLTPGEVVSFLLENKDNELLSGSLDENTLSNLMTLKTLMDSTNNNVTYSASELAKVLDLDNSSVNLLYGVYNVSYKKINVTISLKDFVNFLTNDVMKNSSYSSSFKNADKKSINAVSKIINATLKNTKYSKDEMYKILSDIAADLDKNMLDMVYIYYGSVNNYDNDYKLTINDFVKYLNEDILTDKRFDDYIEKDMRENIIASQDTVNDAKVKLVGKNYSRIVINSKKDPESRETFAFIANMQKDLKDVSDTYIAGNSAMAYEMSQTFNNEMNLITVLTMIFIFIVVVFTFKSLIIPIILVLLIQCAVFLTMGVLTLGEGTVYYMAILIVQSILMGATIDYAILYTSYYQEGREEKNNLDTKATLAFAYNNAINTIITSASILILATFVVGIFATSVTSKICITICIGTICSTFLILILLPSMLCSFDKLIIKKKKLGSK